MKTKLDGITEIIEDIRNGKMVILIDDEDRENEGDIILAADFVTPDAINFMATEARGLICLALQSDQIDRLSLPLMVGDEKNHSPNKTAFTVSIEASVGVSTGISASDRAHTIRVASNPKAKPSDVIMPGHVFPIRAQKGGVLKRAGHTEASVDLAKLAGLNSAAVICEIMKADGTMARLPDLMEFAAKHNIKIGTIEDLIRYRLETETLVREVASSEFPSDFGEDLKVRVFENQLDHSQSLVIQKGEISEDQPTLVRVHVENILGDALGGKAFKPHLSLESAVRFISEQESGVLLYLRKEGENSLFANMVNSKKETTRPQKMDPRDYGIGAQVLRSLGVRRIHLLVNKPMTKVIGLKGFGLEIEEVISVNSQEVNHDEAHDEWFTNILRH